MRRLESERGAITLLFALLIAFLFVPLALVTADFGRFFFERRQLQVGTDVAALEVAFDCARAAGSATPSPACTAAGANATADRTVQANDYDADADATALLEQAQGRVTITATPRTEGEAGINHLLGRLPWIDDTSNTTFETRSRAIWGATAGTQTLPFVAPFSHWDRARLIQRQQWPALTNAQGLFPPGGPFPANPEAAPIIFFTAGEPEHPAGSFGNLETTGSGCTVDLSVYVLATSSGNDFACKQLTATEVRTAFVGPPQPKVLALYPPPPASRDNGLTGKNARYNIVSFAGINLTAYYFNNTYRFPVNGTAGNPRWEPSRVACTSATPGFETLPGGLAIPNNTACIRGWLTATTVTPGPIVPGGTNTGAMSVQLVTP